jgi:hypothetical protein
MQQLKDFKNQTKTEPGCNCNGCSINGACVYDKNDSEALIKYKQAIKSDKESIKNRNAYNAYEVYDANINLYRAMINPELNKQVRFYAPFTMPTYVFQQKTSFSINLNVNVTIL